MQVVSCATAPFKKSQGSFTMSRPSTKLSGRSPRRMCSISLLPHNHHPPDQIYIMVMKTWPSSVGASPLTSSHVQSTPYILGLKYKTPTFHCLHSAPDKTTIIHDLCISSLTPMTEGHFPMAQGSLDHQLFILVFMVTSKVICDDTYLNKLWSIVRQGMFQL